MSSDLKTQMGIMLEQHARDALGEEAPADLASASEASELDEDDVQVVEADPGAAPAPPEPVTSVAPSMTMYPQRRGRGKAAKERPMTKPETQLRAEMFGGAPAVAIKLFRVNPITGGRIEIGSWTSRPVNDWWDRARWVQHYSGGGQYIMSSHPVGNFAQLYHEISFELPGPPLDPLPMREAREKEQAALAPLTDLSSMFGTSGKGGAIHLDPQSMLLYVMLGGQMRQQQPAAPPPDPRIGVLEGQVQAALKEAKAAREELARERSDSKMEARFAALEQRLAAATAPKSNYVEQLVSNLPTLITGVVQIMQTASVRQEAVLSALRHSEDANRQAMWNALEKIAAGQDPSKYAAAQNMLLTTSTSLISGMAKMVQAGAGAAGSPWADMARELVGNIAGIAQQFLPMMIMAKAAEKNPAMAEVLREQLAGMQGEDGELPPAQQPRQMPPAPAAARPQSRLLASPAAPRQAPAGAPPRSPAPGGARAVEESRRIPVPQILRMGRMVREQVPPEKLYEELRYYVEFCERTESVPMQWLHDGTWSKVLEDPVNGLGWLLSLVGQDLELTEEYAAALRAAAKRSSPPAAPRDNGGRASPPAAASTDAEENEDEEGAEADVEDDGSEVLVFDPQPPVEAAT